MICTTQAMFTRVVRAAGSRGALQASAALAALSVYNRFSTAADGAATPGWAPAKKFRVGILGCTGAVGQRFVQYLEGHPWFDVVALAASDKSTGKTYAEATNWQPTANVPAYVRSAPVVRCVPEDLPDVDLVFSALDSGPARDIEIAFRDAGVAVFSNASTYRMSPDVPLVVPPVNGGHLELARTQPSFRSSGGFLVTNANCSTTGLVIALKPIHDAFGIESAQVTTMQAISGAGYPGIPSLDILDNVIPYISGEEAKLETEYAKILGSMGEGGIHEETFPLSAMVHRVHVRDGHCIAVALRLRTPGVTPEDVSQVLASFRPYPAAVASLPSAPAAGFIEVRSEPNRPQPRLDRDAGRGYTTVVGRIRPDPSGLAHVKLFVLSHNTVMGAAGSSILNAELAAATGLLVHRGERGGEGRA